MTKVSVLMTVHNGEKYLRQAVDSVLAQTFPDFEFIIVDDGSHDGTAQILDGYSDSRIILLKNATGIGLTKSLNLGLEKAKGQYTARMDADDISLTHRLDTQVSFLDENPQIGVVGTVACLIDSDNISGKIVQYPESHNRLQWIMCFFENPIIHPSVMFRTQLIKSLGGYNDAYQTSQDYNLWHRVIKSARIANIQDVCLYLRKHEGNISHTRYYQQQMASLEISASMISDTLKNFTISDQLQYYCDFLWNGRQIPSPWILPIARIVFHLSKYFLNNPQIPFSDRLWISDDALNRLTALVQGIRLSPFERIEFNYILRFLKHPKLER